MITLNGLKDWLKTKNVATNYYIGKLDNKKDESLGVYNRTRSGAPVTAIGHLESYDIKAVTLLLHWNNNAKETEAAAMALWAALNDESEITIDGHAIHFIALQVPEPISVGTDDKGVYEYVIDFDLYYRREICQTQQ